MAIGFSRLGRSAAEALRRPIALLTAVIASAAGAAGPLTSPVYLDAGDPAGPRSDAVVLRPGDRYDAARGHGWTTAPSTSFSHPNWGGVRALALTDGVAGEDYTLRLDLAPGRWTVLVYLDDGYLDAHRVALRVGDRSIPHSPRVFGLEAEPPKPPVNRYRVAQAVVEAGAAPTHLRFTHPAHGARLLAVHLLPMSWSESDRTRWFSRQLAEVGTHPSRDPLDGLRTELGQHAADPALAAFATYWKAQLDLLSEAEHWHRMAGWDWVTVKTRSSMFVRYKIALSLLDPLVEHPDGAAFPLRDRAHWLRARLLYWIWKEQHLEADRLALEQDLAALRARHPQDRLIAMYAGEKFPSPDPPDGFTASAAAPAWSTAQFEALRRLRQVAHYWIDERQISNGELGGKPDDDVETLRWWPVLMLSGDTKAVNGFRRLAEGVWFSRHIVNGFSREPRDVEHSAELISDTVPMMALLHRDDEWIGRLAWSHRHLRDLWTGVNQHGDRAVQVGVDWRHLHPRGAAAESRPEHERPRRQGRALLRLAERRPRGGSTAARVEPHLGQGGDPDRQGQARGALSRLPPLAGRRRERRRADLASREHVLALLRLDGRRAALRPTALHLAADGRRDAARPDGGHAFPARAVDGSRRPHG